ncbi:unnamed protein product [Pleuronectes platessa]|uniref:Uncharacterized protein n=1 Tax=Pleuronectes platessa TaxID=8262 RepID=A0A9N7YXA8_PLEPL|nr:unnamed protein product [Pleuronectes platessa]
MDDNTAPPEVKRKHLVDGSSAVGAPPLRASVIGRTVSLKVFLAATGEFRQFDARSLTSTLAVLHCATMHKASLPAPESRGEAFQKVSCGVGNQFLDSLSIDWNREQLLSSS